MHSHSGPIRCAVGARITASGHPNLVIFAGEHRSPIYRTPNDALEDKMWEEIEESWLWEDLLNVSDEFGLSEDDEDKILAEILDLAERAYLRGLKYGHTSKHDISTLAKRNDLLELRIPDPIATSGGKFRGRIYGYEPSATLVEGTVLLLFHVKADGDNALNARQNHYINESAARAEAWEHQWSSRP